MTLLANRPGVLAGVPRVTLTESKSGFLNVRRNWVGFIGESSEEDDEVG